MYNSDAFVVWWVHVHHLFVCIGWVPGGGGGGGGYSTRVSLVHGQMTIKYLHTFLNPFHRIQCSCGSVVEHCVSSTKGCGFNSQETHILIINV